MKVKTLVSTMKEVDAEFPLYQKLNTGLDIVMMSRITENGQRLVITKEGTCYSFKKSTISIERDLGRFTQHNYTTLTTENEFNSFLSNCLLDVQNIGDL